MSAINGGWLLVTSTKHQALAVFGASGSLSVAVTVMPARPPSAPAGWVICNCAFPALSKMIAAVATLSLLDLAVSVSRFVAVRSSLIVRGMVLFTEGASTRLFRPVIEGAALTSSAVTRSRRRLEKKAGTDWLFDATSTRSLSVALGTGFVLRRVSFFQFKLAVVDSGGGANSASSTSSDPSTSANIRTFTLAFDFCRQSNVRLNRSPALNPSTMA